MEQITGNVHIAWWYNVKYKGEYPIKSLRLEMSPAEVELCRNKFAKEKMITL